VAAVQILRQVWLQNYYLVDGQLHWREAGNLPPAEILIQSPYDPEARYSQKQTTAWVGYKAHVTETCDDDGPHLIVNVETTRATRPDGAMTDVIHAHLAQRNLLPAEHLLDAGYVDAGSLASARQDFGIDLIGPAPQDPSWQAQHHPQFALACFAIDWAAQTVTCPAGKRSRVWSSSHDTFGNQVFHVQFAEHDCAKCPVRRQCTRAVSGPRALKLRPQAQHEALQQARTRQGTAAFRTTYAKRSGIEGTISQATNAYELRRARYLGLAKTHLQNIVTAVAINIARVDAWLRDKPRAATRTSKFAALRPTWTQLALCPSPGTAT
jgi:transposase